MLIELNVAITLRTKFNNSELGLQQLKLNDFTISLFHKLKIIKKKFQDKYFKVVTSTVADTLAKYIIGLSG